MLFLFLDFAFGAELAAAAPKRRSTGGADGVGVWSPNPYKLKILNTHSHNGQVEVERIEFYSDNDCQHEIYPVSHAYQSCSSNGCDWCSGWDQTEYNYCDGTNTAVAPTTWNVAPQITTTTNCVRQSGATASGCQNAFKFGGNSHLPWRPNTDQTYNEYLVQSGQDAQPLTLTEQYQQGFLMWRYEPQSFWTVVGFAGNTQVSCIVTKGMPGGATVQYTTDQSFQNWVDAPGTQMNHMDTAITDSVQLAAAQVAQQTNPLSPTDVSADVGFKAWKPTACQVPTGCISYQECFPGQPTVCTACQSGFQLGNDICCQGSHQYFDHAADGSPVCRECTQPANCATTESGCTGTERTCQSCNPGFFLNAGSCQECQKTDSNCEQYSGVCSAANNKEECTSCKSGYKLDVNGVCVDECDTPAHCDFWEGCKDLEDMSGKAYECDFCSDGYYVTEVNGVDACAKCEENVKNCISYDAICLGNGKTTCETCAPGTTPVGGYFCLESHEKVALDLHCAEEQE